MKYIKEILESGLDVENRTIYLHDVIDNTAWDQVVTSLAVLRNVYKEEDCHVTLELNTYGGDLYQGFGIYDAIRRWKGKTTILCAGPVMSAGTVILQAADERLVLPNSDIMIHFGEQTAGDKHTKIHFDYMLKKMENIIGSRTKVSQRAVKKWFTKESYFDVNRALEVGLIDGIIKYEKK